MFAAKVICAFCKKSCCKFICGCDDNGLFIVMPSGNKIPSCRECYKVLRTQKKSILEDSFIDMGLSRQESEVEVHSILEQVFRKH
jgi:Zn-finger protein